MIFHLTDLDELVQRVRNERSKEYLKEAIISYRSGAYRAALIVTWISVCVDIIEKIRELSLEGDSVAKDRCHIAIDCKICYLKNSSISEDILALLRTKKQGTKGKE